jgi:hypothetical protein
VYCLDILSSSFCQEVINVRHYDTMTLWGPLLWKEFCFACICYSLQKEKHDGDIFAPCQLVSHYANYISKTTKFSLQFKLVKLQTSRTMFFIST